MNTKIVTFPCSNNVFVFEEKCSRYPAFPYKIHKSIDSAKNYLKSLDKINIDIVIEKSLENN